jgi:hypothetical protein
MRARFFYGLIVLCLGTPDVPHAGASEPFQTTDEGWRLTFTLSGGIAGLNRQLVLDNSGAATASDRQRDRQVRRQVSRDDLLEIERLVAVAVSFQMPAEDVCRDCLVYAIDLRVAGRTVTIRANDITLAGSKVGPLVRAVTRVQQQLLADR